MFVGYLAPNSAATFVPAAALMAPRIACLLPFFVCLLASSFVFDALQSARATTTKTYKNKKYRKKKKKKNNLRSPFPDAQISVKLSFTPMGLMEGGRKKMRLVNCFVMVWACRPHS